MKKEKADLSTAIIVLLIIFILILFVVSLGSVSSSNLTILPEELKDSKEEAKRRHKRLLTLIEKQEALKIKLDKKFKQIYFFVRLGFILLWVFILYSFQQFGLIKNLGDILNYSQLSIIIIAGLNFLTFGSITNLKTFLDYIKTITQNLVYKKYLSLNQKIKLNKFELTTLEEKLLRTEN